MRTKAKERNRVRTMCAGSGCNEKLPRVRPLKDYHSHECWMRNNRRARERHAERRTA